MNKNSITCCGANIMSLRIKSKILSGNSTSIAIGITNHMIVGHFLLKSTKDLFLNPMTQLPVPVLMAVKIGLFHAIQCPRVVQVGLVLIPPKVLQVELLCLKKILKL